MNNSIGNNSGSAGIGDAARKARIKRKAVRPPVASRVRLTDPLVVEEKATEVKSTIEEEVKKPSITVINNSEEAKVVENKIKGKKSISKKKKKNFTRTEPRAEFRITEDQEELLGNINSKAVRECHALNKGVNNTELFGGVLEFLRPIYKNLKFSSINFKRGSLSGEGTKKIKLEVGKIIERATLKTILEDIEKGEGERFKEVIDKFSEERKQKIISELDSLMTEREAKKLVANS